MIKIYGKYQRRAVNDSGELEITFTVPGYQSKRETDKLEKGQDYNLQIGKPKSKRSLAQNNLLWELIGEICETENGNRNDKDEMHIYCNILQMAGAKCDYFECTEEAYEAFRRQFRVCSVVEERNHKGKKTVMVKAYFGTSTMKTDEMSKVIDKALEYADMIGINTEYWAREFGK